MPEFSLEPQVIFPPPFDFKMECTAEAEGYVDNVLVRLVDGSQFPMCFIDVERLEKECEKNVSQGRPFFAKPGLVVVSRVSPWILTLAVRWIHSQEYFNHVKPLPWNAKRAGEPEVTFPEGCDLEDADKRGYLEGAAVQYEGSIKVPISIMIPLRIRQEILADSINGRPFFTEPGLIIVSDINHGIVTLAVRHLNDEGFFDHIRPVIE